MKQKLLGSGIYIRNKKELPSAKKYSSMEEHRESSKIYAVFS